MLCEEQNENGDDEIVVTTSISWSDGKYRSKIWWQGDMTDDDPSRRGTGEGRLWDIELARGEAASISVSVIEQDGQNYGLALKFATEIGKVAAMALAGTGRASATAGADAGAAFSAVDFGAIVDKAEKTIGLTNSDDWIGTFVINLHHRPDGRLESRIDCAARCRFLENPKGRLQLDGDGARYYPGVIINGTRVGQNHLF